MTKKGGVGFNDGNTGKTDPGELHEVFGDQTGNSVNYRTTQYLSLASRGLMQLFVNVGKAVVGLKNMIREGTISPDDRVWDGQTAQEFVDEHEEFEAVAFIEQPKNIKKLPGKVGKGYFSGVLFPFGKGTQSVEGSDEEA